MKRLKNLKIEKLQINHWYMLDGKKVAYAGQSNGIFYFRPRTIRVKKMDVAGKLISDDLIKYGK